MKIRLNDEHKKHLRGVGHTWLPRKAVLSAEEFAEAVTLWKASGVPSEELEKRAISHVLWKRKKREARSLSLFRRFWLSGALLLIVFTLVPFVHCQYDGPVLPLDSVGNVAMDCVLGCSASAGFADNSAFVAGTTPISLTAGWYTTSPTNCTSGDACAPQLTIDRKLFVQSFQGTSPWVVSANGGSFAVTGTFWQATQPISGSVSVSNFPATQPVSGTVAISNASIAVTGTFFQATQPVSLATLPALTAGTAVIGHVIVDTAPSTAVTNAGTFAVQATLAAETTKVIGTVNIAAAQTIGLAAGSAVIGHVIVDTTPTTAVTESGTWTVQPGNTANTTPWLVTSRIVGNTGATLDAAPAAALPTNVLVIAGRDSTQTGGGTAVPVVCDKSAAITATAAASVVVIPLAASKTTYICGFVVTGAGAAGTMQWKSGTGTTCGTGTVNLTGAMATAIGGTISYGNGLGTILRHALAAQDTCITMATASATAAGIVSYAQF